MEYLSDCESIRTEDFAVKFSELVNNDHSKDSGFSCERTDACLTPTNLEEDNFYQKQQPLKKNSSTEKDKFCQPQKTNFKTLDLDSVATELFEDQINTIICNENQHVLSGRSMPTESCSTSLNIDIGNLSFVQPIRRDIMNKFLSKYAAVDTKIDTEKRSTANRIVDPLILSNNRAAKPGQHFIPSADGSPWMKCRDSSTSRNYGALFKNKVDLANEIRTKSMRIQEEIHEERKRKQETIQEKSFIKEQTPREKLDMKVKELDILTDRMKKARSERERLSAELNLLKNKLKQRSDDLRSDPKKRSGRFSDSLSSDSDNLIPHFQTAQNDLNQLNQQLEQKKVYLKELESRIRERLGEIKDLEAVGLSRKEIEQVIEERNELYDMLRQAEEIGNNRYELEKILTAAREELSLEKIRSKEKIGHLEQELNNYYNKLKDSNDAKDRIQKELMVLKDENNRNSEEMNELFCERNELRRQIDKIKDDVDSERQTSREFIDQERKRLQNQLATEEAKSKLFINDLKNQITTFYDEIKNKDDRIASLKTKISELEGELDKLRKHSENQDILYKDSMQKLKDEHNFATEHLKREIFTNKENEIQTLKTEFDSEQIRTINSMKECYKQQISDLQCRIENKSQEIQDLRNECRKQKAEFTEKHDNLQYYHECQLTRLKDEHSHAFENMEKKRLSDISEIKNTYENLLSKMKKELEEERSFNVSLRNALEKANKDAAQELELSKKYKQEKSMAVHRIKDIAKEKVQQECKRIKEFYEKELEEQLTIMDKTMEERNSHFEVTTNEISHLEEELLKTKSLFQGLLNQVTEEIKKQCNEMASSARFIPPLFSSIKSGEYQEYVDNMKSVIKNLELCHQEFSQYFYELIDKTKDEKEKTIKSIEEKSSKEILALKEQILKDHADEINSLTSHHKQEVKRLKSSQDDEIEKMKLKVKEWKIKTADRIAQKLQKELRKELEKKSLKSDMKQTSSLHSFRNEPSVVNMKPIGLIEDLRSNIRHLREENLALRKVIVDKSTVQNGNDNRRNSYCDLSTSEKYSDKPNYPYRPQSVCQDNQKCSINGRDEIISRSNSFKAYK